MLGCLCEYKALVNAYKCEITEKSHFLVVNGYDVSLTMAIGQLFVASSLLPFHFVNKFVFIIP